MIAFESIRHSYGDREVLRGVTLTLTEPRVGIIGANGSGKSTLARLVNGLVTPTEGRVLVDGLDVAVDGAAVRRRVGFIFPDPDAQIVMPTVAEDVAFSLRRRKLGRAETARQVREVLGRFNLQDHADHPAHLLSSGQKQLLALAAILVTEPSVLVCDEPTTLLDLRNRNLVAHVLAALPHQVIIATHDLELAAQAQRVILIDAGRVAADGDATTVIAAYRALLA
ncbi:MAG: ABC transporter ATP-binding protein [Austwickia sp.]|nr:ABC transporter ATP-binding protein [Austwickia sp.]